MVNHMRRNTISETTADKVFDCVNYVVLSFVFISMLYPLIYIISASLSSASAVLSNKVWLWPIDINIDGYKAVFRHKLIGSGYFNTIFYTVVGTIINLFMTVLTAYPLSRKNLVGKSIISFIFVFTMFFSGGLIPTYLVVKNLGLINTRWAMIIPGALGVWNVIVTRTYFQSNIPDEMLEAAQIDGCSDIRFVISVVLPLSIPVLAVMTLFYAVGHWNSYFNALIYLSNSKLYPLQLVLREILIQNEIYSDLLVDPVLKQRMENLREVLKYALIVVSTMPILVFALAMQKYFVKGIMIGALKG